MSPKFIKLVVLGSVGYALSVGALLVWLHITQPAWLSMLSPLLMQLVATPAWFVPAMLLVFIANCLRATAV
jgi:hypothetical protein